MRAYLWITSVALALTGCARADLGAALQPFAGQDLRRLGDQDKARLKQVLAACVPDFAQKDPFWPTEPWFLWPRQPADGRPGYILFAGRRLFKIPGSSYAAVHLLAADGRHLSRWEFSTGWRIDIKDAALRLDPTLRVPVIEVRTAPSINGANIRRQLYGLFEDRVALLRIEAGDGTLVENNYHNPNHTIGPPAPPLPPEEWERALQEGSPARALEALTWVGGHHRTDRGPPPPHLCLEDANSVQRVAEVRQRPEVHRAIRRLAQSEHPWVREAACAALQELGEDPNPG